MEHNNAKHEIIVPQDGFPFKTLRAGEEKLLYAMNKWLLAHPDAGIEGAYEGLRGENICLDKQRRIGWNRPKEMLYPTENPWG